MKTTHVMFKVQFSRGLSESMITQVIQFMKTELLEYDTVEGVEEFRIVKD